MLLIASCGHWGLVERVVRAVHQRILTKHRSHLDCGKEKSGGIRMGDLGFVVDMDWEADKIWLAD
jgi:hypothetical protein